MSHKVIVDDLLVEFIRSGKGKDVLLIHGWADSSNTFKDQIVSLSKKYRVTALDLPGFGKSQAPKDEWSLGSYARFLKSFCKKLDFKPYAIVGHSNGGALAIHAIAKNELVAERLILLAASGVRTPGGIRRLGLKTIAKTGKVMTFWLPRGKRLELQKLLYGAAGSDMLIAPHLKETFKRTVRQDIQQDASKLKLPTLLIYGDNDRATPFDKVGEVLQRNIVDSHLMIMHGDHFIHQTASAAVSKQILEFLK